MTIDDRDFYRLLGVDPSSDTTAIHRAYRDLARRFHPDVTGDEATMKLINVAWYVLRDDARRASYDTERGVPPRTTIAAGAPEPAPRASQPDHAGPPPGAPFGPVLTYGRYAGWSLGEIGRADPGYLDWLRDAPGYRWLRADVDAILKALDAAPPTRHGAPKDPLREPRGMSFGRGLARTIGLG